MLPKSRDLTIPIGAIILATIVGGLFFNPYDVPNYVWVSNGLLNGENIYQELDYVMYPPFLYFIGAFFMGIIEFILDISIVPGRNQYIAMMLFAFIAAVPQVIAYQLGSVLINDSDSRAWLFGVLGSPLAIFVVLFHGQMTSYVVLGFVAVIYAIHTDHHHIGGLGLIIAASVKIYPAVLFLPYLIRCRDHWRGIVIGATPIAILNLALLGIWFPASLSFLVEQQNAIRPINILHIISPSLGIIDVNTIFKISLLVMTMVAVIAPIEDDIAMVLPLFPVVFLYVDTLEYRWLALAIAAILVGLVDIHSDDNELRRRFYQLGWVTTICGMAGMLFGQMTGLVNGVPWWELTFWTWPSLPDDFTARPLTLGRQGISIVLFFVSMRTLASIDWRQFWRDTLP